MDPVSVGYLILKLVQVTKNAYSLIDSIKCSMPKVDQIHYRILAEKATTEAWANQMRIANGRDSALSIPSHKLDEVTNLLNKLVEHIKAAEAKYAKIQLKSADHKNTIANLRVRAVIVWSGYNDLNDLVNVIASMNKALLTISPAQAAQFPRKGTDDSIQNVHDAKHLPSLQCIYELCLNAMDTMADWGRHPLLQTLPARLKLWGAGIFELPVPLDTVLMLREKDSNDVRELFLKAMAIILVRQGMFLPHLGIHSATSDTTVEQSLGRYRDSITDQTGDVYRQQIMIQAEISSILGTEELLEYSLESWANSLQVQNELALLRGQHPASEPDSLHDMEAILDYNFIKTWIDRLFSLLPAIRNERKPYSRVRKAEQAAKGGDTQSLTASTRANNTVKTICTKLKISPRKEMLGRAN